MAGWASHEGLNGRGHPAIALEDETNADGWLNVFG
jgi:hypothetical protein